MSLQNEKKINITPAVMRKSGVYTIEIDEDNLSAQIKRTENDGTVTEKQISLPTVLDNVQPNDALVANADGDFANVPLDTVIGQATLQTQGYYGLLSASILEAMLRQQRLM